MLVVANRSVDIDCGSQSTDLFPAILAECNGSVTRVSLIFMLNKIVIFFLRVRSNLTVQTGILGQSTFNKCFMPEVIQSK